MTRPKVSMPLLNQEYNSWVDMVERVSSLLVIQLIRCYFRVVKLSGVIYIVPKLKKCHFHQICYLRWCGTLTVHWHDLPYGAHMMGPCLSPLLNFSLFPLLVSPANCVGTPPFLPCHRALLSSMTQHCPIVATTTRANPHPSWRSRERG